MEISKIFVSGLAKLGLCRIFKNTFNMIKKYIYFQFFCQKYVRQHKKYLFNYKNIIDQLFFVYKPNQTVKPSEERLQIRLPNYKLYFICYL